MANLTSIARPYATAAFQVAREQKQFAEWKAFLETAGLVAQNEKVIRAAQDPETPKDQLLAFFESLVASMLDSHRKNFLALLVEKRRLLVLPNIVHLFNELLTTEAKISTAQLITAVTIDEATRQKFEAVLKKRTQRDITLECRLDPQILGGAIIQMDDRVIDGSIRGKLSRLLEFSLR